jgi:hypothetical protein
MFRYITPILLIAIAVVGFIMFTNPILSDISKINSEIASYNEALNNAKALENERDKLTQKYNSIDPNNLNKLQKLLPDNVDNIRLILEIEKLASPYGMVLKDVKYDSTLLNDKGDLLDPRTTPQISSRSTTEENNKQYGTWVLGFSTEGSYSNFVSLIKDIESNLRIVDISSVAFSSNVGTVLGKPKLTDSYKYDFKIKTYWLKN